MIDNFLGDGPRICFQRLGETKGAIALVMAKLLLHARSYVSALLLRGKLLTKGPVNGTGHALLKKSEKRFHDRTPTLLVSAMMKCGRDDALANPILEPIVR